MSNTQWCDTCAITIDNDGYRRHRALGHDVRADDPRAVVTDEAAAIAYLTQDGKGSHWRTPASRYGWNSGACAPVAYAVGVILAGETGEPLTIGTLDYVMGLVVNNHDDPEALLRDYGGGYGFKAEDYLE